MSHNPSKTEQRRRKLHPVFDTEPSLLHRLNYHLALPYIRNKRVLDIGCWTGQFESLVQRQVKRIVGLDPNPDAIMFAKKHLPLARFVLGVAEKLPFPDAVFDVVTFFEVIEHLPEGNDLKSLQEIHRVLKPNGHLILSTPNKHPVSILLDPAYFLMGHRHYSQPKLEQMLRQTGFRVIHAFISGGIVQLLTIIIELLYKHLMNRKPEFPAFIKRRLEREYAPGGISTIHVVAQKTVTRS